MTTQISAQDYNFKQAEAAFLKMRELKEKAQAEYEATMAELGWVKEGYQTWEDYFEQFQPKAYKGNYDSIGQPEGDDNYNAELWYPLGAE